MALSLPTGFGSRCTTQAKKQKKDNRERSKTTDFFGQPDFPTLRILPQCAERRAAYLDVGRAWHNTNEKLSVESVSSPFPGRGSERRPWIWTSIQTVYLDVKIVKKMRVKQTKNGTRSRSCHECGGPPRGPRRPPHGPGRPPRGPGCPPCGPGRPPHQARRAVEIERGLISSPCPGRGSDIEGRVNNRLYRRNKNIEGTGREREGNLFENSGLN